MMDMVHTDYNKRTNLRSKSTARRSIQNLFVAERIITWFPGSAGYAVDKQLGFTHA